MNEIRKHERILANERNLTNEWNLKKIRKNNKKRKLASTLDISLIITPLFTLWICIINITFFSFMISCGGLSYHKTPEKTRCENNHVDQDEKPSWFWWCKSFHFIKIHQRPLKWENEWKWMKIMANYVALFD